MDDDEFLRRFEACLLTREEWTHRAHIKVGYLYLAQLPFEAALRRIRSGIQSLNAALHVEETSTSGYNETTTRAFLHLIAATMRAYSNDHSFGGADNFCDKHPQLLTRHALRFFYSRRQRSNPLAKTQFIEPDLAPLPKILPSADPPADSNRQ